MVFKVEKLPALEEVLYFILQHQRIVGIKNAVYLNIVLLQASIFQQSPIILFQQTKQLARANFDHSVKCPAISVFSIFFLAPSIMSSWLEIDLQYWIFHNSMSTVITGQATSSQRR